jgi:hypothetical protein
VPVINPEGTSDKEGKWNDFICTGVDAVAPKFNTANYVCKTRANIVASAAESSALSVIVMILYILVSFGVVTYCCFIVYTVKCSPRLSATYANTPRPMSTTSLVDDELF